MASVYTVAQVTSYISHLFEEDFALKRISIQGEISNCKKHSGGHLYFTLKDETSTLSCVMFASNRAKLTFIPSEGMRVIARGSVRIYERDGVYQLYVTQLEPAGVGEWFRLFEERKAQFEEMGMFSEEYKKPIPRFAKKVGVVTAKTGAAIQDIINITHRRNPYVQLILYPTLVQGESAAVNIAAGIDYLDTLGLDVIIVGRGGGSIEDLWAFNEECVAMAIFRCETPVISAVGHETDFTIADFIADMRAPTPSAAAEIAVPENEGMSLAVMNNYRRLNYLMDSILSSSKNTLQTLSTKHCFTGFADNIYDNELYVSQLQNRLLNKMQSKIELASQNLKHRIDNLENISPLKILQKGYSLTYDDSQKLIRSAKNINVGDKINVVFNDGNITATVEEVRNNNGYKENL